MIDEDYKEQSYEIGLLPNTAVNYTGKEFVGIIHTASKIKENIEYGLSVHVPELGDILINVKTYHNIPKNNWVKIKIIQHENNNIIGELIYIINDRIDTIIEEKFDVNNIRSSVNEPISTLAGNKEHQDLTHHTVFTIDQDDSSHNCERGFSIQTIDDITHIYIHISDVAHFINPNHPMFETIIKRGNSFVGDKKKWGMLPEVYSEFICSILPLKNTYVITLEFTYNENEIQLVDWYYSTIRSSMRYTYREVDDVIDFDNLYNPDLTILYESAMHIKRYFNDFDLSLSSKSQMTVKYWLIYANKIMSSKINGIYRINPPPTDNKLLNNYVRHFHPDLDINTRAKIVNFANENDTPLLYFILEETIKHGSYSYENDFHYGIGTNDYTHFTSPMNRLCDLINHCLLKRIYYKENNTFDIVKYVKYMNSNESKQHEIYEFIKKYNIFQRCDIGDVFNATVIDIQNECLIVYIEELNSKFCIQMPDPMNECFYLFKQISLIVKSIMFDNVDFSILVE
jgi:exoribonuclease R